MFLTIEFSHINIFCFFRKILEMGNAKNLYGIGLNRVCKNEERMGERTHELSAFYEPDNLTHATYFIWFLRLRR